MTEFDHSFAEVQGMAQNRIFLILWFIMVVMYSNVENIGGWVRKVWNGVISRKVLYQMMYSMFCVEFMLFRKMTSKIGLRIAEYLLSWKFLAG